MLDQMAIALAVNYKYASSNPELEFWLFSFVITAHLILPYDHILKIPKNICHKILEVDLQAKDKNIFKTNHCVIDTKI